MSRLRGLRRSLRGVSLRARLTLIAALAVAVAVAGIASAAYIAVSKQLRDQEDSSLQMQYQSVTSHQYGLGQLFQNGFAPTGTPFVQQVTGTLIDGTGTDPHIQGSQSVVNPRAFVDVATGQVTQRIVNTSLTSGVRVRVLAVHATLNGQDVAVLIERNVSDDDKTLDHLRLLLFVAGGLGVLLAAAGGLVVSRSGLKPVDRLTAAAEQIAATEELDVPIEVSGSDEIARLALAFNSMTAALSSSRKRQQQLVADAGHELRTPLTSMRTNLDLLVRSERSGRALPTEDRERLIEDLSAQMDELGTLVGELVNLARDDRATEPLVPVDFADVVGRAVDRARLRTEGTIEVSLQSWPVLGRPNELERAVINLLDNAVKFSPAGEPVVVHLADGELTVTDRGPGLSEEDRPHVFERFYRSTTARGMPGSGLGLAIVAQTVSAHGGIVALDPGFAGGGTVARLRLPGLQPGTADSSLEDWSAGDYLDTGLPLGADYPPPPAGAPPGYRADEPDRIGVEDLSPSMQQPRHA